MIKRNLKTAGISWSIVYTYFKLLDINEKRWDNVSTANTRKNAYDRISTFEMIDIIKNTDTSQLHDNDFEVSKEELDVMKKKIIKYYDDNAIIKNVSIHISQEYLYLNDCKELINILEESIEETKNDGFSDFNYDIKFTGIRKGSIILDIAIGVVSSVAAEFIIRGIDHLIKKLKEKTKNNEDINIEDNNLK